MSGLADISLSLGCEVTGSDLRDSATIQDLIKKGAKISIGHDRNFIGDAEVVVHTSAVDSSNPEIDEANLRRIPLIKRGKFLASIMDSFRGISITGTHGKTSTTSIVVQSMMRLGLNPSYSVGGVLTNTEKNSGLDTGEFFVSEADESDGSFFYQNPEFAIVTNVDADHLEHYGGIEDLQKIMENFIANVAMKGKVIVCGDDPFLNRISTKYNDVVTFGIENTDSKYLARNIRYDGDRTLFDLRIDDVEHQGVSCDLMGKHNVYNVLAAIALLNEIGANMGQVISAISHYKGVGRRLEKIENNYNTLLFDDYAHHPTEIKYVISALKKSFPAKKINVIFEPHRYSRVSQHINDFASSFKEANQVYVGPIYAASERSIRGLDVELLVELIGKNSGCCVSAIEGFSAEILKNVLSQSRDELVVAVGAGILSRSLRDTVSSKNN